ncbi:MAG: hypothetical protein C0494_16910 [Sphingobium sp.]|nr:hypothetical protein [Sphingobium sp.]
MKNIPIALIVAWATGSAGLAEGPISKFDAKAPEAAYVSSAKLEDIERCLIDMEGLMPPMIFRQPDRPDAVTLLWRAGMGLSVGRVDLRRQPDGTKIVSWFGAKQVIGCAPKG